MHPKGMPRRWKGETLLAEAFYRKQPKTRQTFVFTQENGAVQRWNGSPTASEGISKSCPEQELRKTAELLASPLQFGQELSVQVGINRFEQTALRLR
jgi:hypothetical protein